MNTITENTKLEIVIKTHDLCKEYKVKERTAFWKDLFKPTYKTIRAVKNISFSIQKGESVAFIGPNGAGKTTTTKMLSGLMCPTSGTVNVLGYTPFERNREMLMRIGLVMGNKTGLNWDLTPLQSYQLFKKIYRIDEAEYEERLTFLTKLLNVEQYLNTQVRRLSLGERMKAELIGAILHNPDVLFLDEPTLGLDLISRQRIREFLRQIQHEFDVTLLLTSHDMVDVEKVCDRVIIITEGSIIYDDMLKTLMDSYTHQRHLTFVYKQKPPRESVEQGNIGEIVDEDENSWSFSVQAEKTSDLIAYQMKKFKILDVNIISPPLDEIISGIFAGERNEE